MSLARQIALSDGSGARENEPVDLPLNHPRMRGFVRDLARGRPAVISELRGAIRVWFPVINGERIPTGDSFGSQRDAILAARDFRDRCREELARD